MRAKRKASLVLGVCLAFFAIQRAFAEIEPPRGEIEYYTDKYGWMCVVLCEELTVRESPSFDAPADGKPLTWGSEFVTTEQQGEWRDFVTLRDGSKMSWVRAEYVIVDPAHYITETETPVYAYDGADSPRVALLETGANLPILKETDTGYIVGLRGASGFIRK